MKNFETVTMAAKYFEKIIFMEFLKSLQNLKYILKCVSLISFLFISWVVLLKMDTMPLYMYIIAWVCLVLSD